MCKEEWPHGVPRRINSSSNGRRWSAVATLRALYAFNSYRIVAGDNIAIVLLTEIITLCVPWKSFKYFARIVIWSYPTYI